jgi:hypothetical protein
MIQFTEGKRKKVKSTCERCGYEWIQNERQLYRETAELKFCRSCKATESKSVMRDGWVCSPHRGEVDLDTMTPLDRNGKPYLPGTRICGMLDCITKAHIITEAPTNKKDGKAVLAGKVITYTQFLEIEKARKAKK